MNASLNIGLIADSHYPRIGGMEHENHWLATAFRSLPETRVAVACSTMAEVPRDFPYPYPVYRHSSLSILTGWLSRRSARRMIAQTRANILHGAMLHGGGYRAVKLGQRFGFPVAVRVHGADLQIVREIGYGALLDPVLSQRVRYAVRHADIVSVPCRRLRDAAIEAGGAPERVLVVPPGIDADALRRIPLEDARQRHGVGKDAFLIVTVGRNRPIKRLELLLAALQMVAKEVPQIRCLCAGPEETLRESIRRFGLETIVTPIGVVRPRPATAGETAAPAPDLVNLYRAADVYAATSYRESFGLAALDAMACGAPALVTRGQGVEDVIVDGANGLVVDDLTASGVAAGLRRMIAEKGARQRVETAKSVSHLSWNNAATQLADSYREIVAMALRKNGPRRSASPMAQH